MSSGSMGEGMRHEPPEESLGETELQAIRQLDPELQEHSALMQTAFDLLQDLLIQIPEMRMAEMPSSMKIGIGLLARLANDLRCAGLLAHRGYAVQACALVASMYEVAFTVAYIGSDETLAQAWVDHDDPTRSFRDVMTMTREGLRRFEDVPDPDAQAVIEYRVYSQLCMARHANPRFQIDHILRKHDETAEVSPLIGPDGLEAVRPAQFCMEHGCALVFIAAANFFKEHLGARLPDDVARGLVERIHAVGAKRKKLEANAKIRWGTKDPFPGKWRALGSSS